MFIHRLEKVEYVWDSKKIRTGYVYILYENQFYLAIFWTEPLLNTAVDIEQKNYFIKERHQSLV